MKRCLSLFLFALLLLAAAGLRASAESEALGLLNEADARVAALSAVRSPSLSNFDKAKGELSVLGPFFERLGASLAALDLGPSARLVELGAAVQVKVKDAGQVKTVDLAVLIEACRGINADLEQWKALLPEMRRLLQARVDEQTQALVREQVALAFPTPRPALGNAPGVVFSTPTPQVPAVQPTATQTLPPLVPVASTPTPVLPGDPGLIPGGAGPLPPPPPPTPLPGQPTLQPTPRPQLKAPVPVAAARNGQKVWVANVAAGTVGVMDASLKRFVASVAVGSQPSALALDDGDGTLVVANAGSNSVTLVDARADRALKTIPVAEKPLQVLVTHGGKAYVLCQEGRKVSVIDLKRQILVKAISLSSRPGRMDLPNSHQTLYVSLPDEDAVAVIDLGLDEVTATVPE